MPSSPDSRSDTSPLTAEETRAIVRDVVEEVEATQDMRTMYVAATAGAGTLAGGLGGGMLAGPFGALFGGAAGGVIGTYVGLRATRKRPPPRPLLSLVPKKPGAR